MNHQKIHELFENAIDSGRSYSGRGMMGRSCFAIVGTQEECMRAIGDVIKEAAEELMDTACDAKSEEELRVLRMAHVDFNDLVNTLMVFEQDQMGRDDVVVYWTRIKPPEILLDDDDDDEGEAEDLDPEDEERDRVL